MNVVDFEPGTWAHKFLNGIGITEDRYREVKQAIGLPPNCSCKARAEWMNKVWKWAWSQGMRSLVLQALRRRGGVEEYKTVTEPVRLRKCRRGRKRTDAENALRREAITEGRL